MIQSLIKESDTQYCYEPRADLFVKIQSVRVRDGVVIRRARSCHGSDCPCSEHVFRDGRCLVVTRRDDIRRRLSWLIVSGDLRESRTRKVLEIGFDKSGFYGGGFWNKVEFPPLVIPEPVAT